MNNQHNQAPACTPTRWGEPVDANAGARFGIAAAMFGLVVCTSLLVAMAGHAAEVAIGWIIGGGAAVVLCVTRIARTISDNNRALAEAVKAAQEVEAKRIREMNIRTAPKRRGPVTQYEDAGPLARSFFAKTKTDARVARKEERR